MPMAFLILFYTKISINSSCRVFFVSSFFSLLPLHAFSLAFSAPLIQEIKSCVHHWFFLMALNFNERIVQMKSVPSKSNQWCFNSSLYKRVKTKVTMLRNTTLWGTENCVHYPAVLRWFTFNAHWLSGAQAIDNLCLLLLRSWYHWWVCHYKAAQNVPKAQTVVNIFFCAVYIRPFLWKMLCLLEGSCLDEHRNVSVQLLLKKLIPYHTHIYLNKNVTAWSHWVIEYRNLISAFTFISAWRGQDTC